MLKKIVSFFKYDVRTKLKKIGYIPKVKLDQKVFDQIARYNLQVRSQFIMLTNGLNHYFCKMDYKNQQYLFIKKIPKYRSY